jgi:hypothetical protein
MEFLFLVSNKLLNYIGYTKYKLPADEEAILKLYCIILMTKLE